MFFFTSLPTPIHRYFFYRRLRRLTPHLIRRVDSFNFHKMNQRDSSENTLKDKAIRFFNNLPSWKSSAKPPATAAGKLGPVYNESIHQTNDLPRNPTGFVEALDMAWQELRSDLGNIFGKTFHHQQLKTNNSLSQPDLNNSGGAVLPPSLLGTQHADNHMPLAPRDYMPPVPQSSNSIFLQELNSLRDAEFSIDGSNLLRSAIVTRPATPYPTPDLTAKLQNLSTSTISPIFTGTQTAPSHKPSTSCNQDGFITPIDNQGGYRKPFGYTISKQGGRQSTRKATYNLTKTFNRTFRELSRLGLYAEAATYAQEYHRQQLHPFPPQQLSPSVTSSSEGDLIDIERNSPDGDPSRLPLYSTHQNIDYENYCKAISPPPTYWSWETSNCIM